MPSPDHLSENTPLIPDPPAVRDRLYYRRMAARLLARILKVAEDCAKVLPASCKRKEASRVS